MSTEVLFNHGKLDSAIWAPAFPIRSRHSPRPGFPLPLPKWETFGGKLAVMGGEWHKVSHACRFHVRAGHTLNCEHEASLFWDMVDAWWARKSWNPNLSRCAPKEHKLHLASKLTLTHHQYDSRSWWWCPCLLHREGPPSPYSILESREGLSQNQSLSSR